MLGKPKILFYFGSPSIVVFFEPLSLQGVPASFLICCGSAHASRNRGNLRSPFCDEWGML